MMLVRKLARQSGVFFLRGSFLRFGSDLFTKGINLSTLFKFQLWDCIFFDLRDEKSDIYPSLKS